MTNEKIMCALIEQVSKAARGHNETDVVTFITKPMWRAFLKATGTDPKSKPTGWNGLKNTVRVYGSHTVVVDSKKMASFSVLMATK